MVRLVSEGTGPRRSPTQITAGLSCSFFSMDAHLPTPSPFVCPVDPGHRSRNETNRPVLLPAGLKTARKAYKIPTITPRSAVTLRTLVCDRHHHDDPAHDTGAHDSHQGLEHPLDVGGTRNAPSGRVQRKTRRCSVGPFERRTRTPCPPECPCSKPGWCQALSVHPGLSLQQ